MSIHRNSSETPNQYMGVESLVYDLSGIKYEMAQNINAQLETVGFVNLGVKARPNLVVLRRTRMPAVLVEVGFINSDTDNKIFDENFEDIVEAIARGIIETIQPDHMSGNVGTERYSVQVGSFRNMRYAERLKQELQGEDFPAYIEKSGEFNRVRVGKGLTLEEATRLEQVLRKSGYQTVIVN